MPHRAEGEAVGPLPSAPGEVFGPPSGRDRDEAPDEGVWLGVGSRCRLVESGHEAASPDSPRGLLLVPPEVEAEVASQEASHPMTPAYRQALRDRLTLAYYFADVEVAFRRTPAGIVILATGADDIAAFRRTSTPAERQGAVYGVG